MPDFLRTFTLDRVSFWLGFLAATLVWWLLRSLSPLASRLGDSIRQSWQEARADVLAITDVRHRNDTIRRSQHLHLAAPLFALDEILIPPRLMAPPPSETPGNPPAPFDITDHVLPYLPDWPKPAAIYGSPTLSLAEALQGGSNLAIIGGPGSGKTVALAHLAFLCARRDPSLGALQDRSPFFIHASELEIPERSPEPAELESEPVDPLAVLSAAVRLHASRATQAKLDRFITARFSQGRALLLLDGLDEMPVEDVSKTVDFLEELLSAYPQTRVAAAAPLHHFNGLMTRLGFVPLALAGWSHYQREAFIERWGHLWMEHIASALSKNESRAEPNANSPANALLLNGWLLADQTPLTPLELTLKSWSAYAGDILGPTPDDAIEAYIRRTTAQAPKGRQAIEQLAAQIALARKPAPTRKEAAKWIAEWENPAVQSPVAQEEKQDAAVFTSLEETESPASTGASRQTSFAASRLLPQWIEHSLLIERPGDRLEIVHPVIGGYLGSRAFSTVPEQIPLEPDGWVWYEQTLHYLAARNGLNGRFNTLMSGVEQDPLSRGLFQAARWLPAVKEDSSWAVQVLRTLAEYMQDESQALGLRARAMTALAESGYNSIPVLMRNALNAPQSETRQLAALGCGILRDTKAVKGLAGLLGDPSPNVRRAACLALVAVGDKPALESVAAALLNGDEELRRAAAEALANHPEEGHPTLQEGSTLDDLLVRRAVVFGLKRTRAEWAREVIQRVQMEDSQWVVQNAATEALEELDAKNPRIPQPFPPLTETPWLIAFAGEKGIGVAPGKPAYDLLHLAIREGKEEEALAAIEYLARRGDAGAVLPLYETYYSDRGALREAALNALWQLAGAGIDLPPPVQFGL